MESFGIYVRVKEHIDAIYMFLITVFKWNLSLSF